MITHTFYFEQIKPSLYTRGNTCMHTLLLLLILLLHTHTHTNTPTRRRRHAHVTTDTSLGKGVPMAAACIQGMGFLETEGLFAQYEPHRSSGTNTEPQ